MKGVKHGALVPIFVGHRHGELIGLRAEVLTQKPGQRDLRSFSGHALLNLEMIKGKPLWTNLKRFP